jgi:hypothetical protein
MEENMRQNKVVVPGKVQKNNSRNFKIKKDKDSELDVDVDIEEDGAYEVDKLSIEGLPTHMKDGTPIRWFTNFAIKKNGQYINQHYKVKVPGLAASLASSRLVIFDGNGDPYYYTGEIVDDTFELTDGDPGIGHGP